MEKVALKKYFSILVVLLLGSPAFADVVWPSLYIATGIVSLKVIFVGLLVELFFVKYFTNIRWLKAGIVTFIMNSVSFILGMIHIPVSGLIAELIMPFNTFHWTHWVVSYLLAIIINTLVEGFIIKLILKLQLKDTYLWLFGANAISILICIIFYGIRLGVKL